MSVAQNVPRQVSLGSSMGSFVGSFVLSAAAYLVVSAAAARLLGTAGFATFLFAYTVALVAGPVALIGIHRSGLREVARLTDRASADAARLRDDIRVVSLTTLPLVSVLAGVVVATVAPTAASRPLLGALSAVLVYASGHQKILGNYLRGLGRPGIAALLQGRSGGGLIGSLQAVLLGVLWLTLGTASLPLVLAAVVAAYLPPLLVGHVILRRDLPATGPRRGLVPGLTAIWRRDWRFLLASSSTSLSWYVELWIAVITLTPSVASWYGAAHRLAQLVALPQSAMQTVFSPAIARSWHHGTRAQVTSLVRTGASLSFAVALVGFVCVAAAPGPLLGLVFGDAFREAALLLVIIVVGVVVNTATGLCGTTLSMAGREGSVAAVSLSSLALRVALGVPAAMLGGAVWLAVSTATVTVLQNVVLWWVARRVLSINTLPLLRPRLRALSSFRA